MPVDAGPTQHRRIEGVGGRPFGTQWHRASVSSGIPGIRYDRFVEPTPQRTSDDRAGACHSGQPAARGHHARSSIGGQIEEACRAALARRNPESYVAGAAVLNQEGPRFSSDIDIFHDLEEAVAQAADSDAAVLSAQGYQVQWVRREPGIHIATVN